MSKELTSLVVEALKDIKGQNIMVLDTSEKTDVFDTIVVVTGTSNRQVRALAENALIEAKKAGFKPIGIEGKESSEWVLVDFGDVVVHAMLPQTREFYDLEKLWGHPVDTTAE